MVFKIKQCEMSSQHIIQLLARDLRLLSNHQALLQKLTTPYLELILNFPQKIN